MFKFLKKKIKKFEDTLEAELEHEINKDISDDMDHDDQSSEFQQDTKDTDMVPPVEPEVTAEPVEPQTPPVQPDQDRKEHRRRQRANARKKREMDQEKQIEESIAAELQHTIKTRKSIGEKIGEDRKASRGISEEKLDELLWELEIGLLESDVAYSVIESIKHDIKDELKDASIQRGKISEFIEEVLRHAIEHVLESNTFNFMNYLESREKPIVIMFVGVNGSGKTTSIAKLATFLKNNGYSSVMAAGDTFRAGAIEQLGIHADRVGVKLIKHGPGADPAAVAYDAIEHAKAKHKDVVLLDTAGRMQTNVNLMDEMEKIKRISQPDLIVFVGDALAGNDAVEQAKRFNEIVGIDGVILTKVDTDAKGGSALSVAYTIGKPLLFIGVGQEYDDQIPFDAQWMIDNIFTGA
jgi:fused signal recognition particle receptor